MVRGHYTTLLFAFLLIENVTSLFNADDTQPGDFPFMARLSSSWRPSGHWCGASLISSRTVLTAAHCVEYYPGWRSDPADLVITLGDYARNQTEESEKRIEVSRIIVHEEYHRGTFEEPFNDIALLILAEEVDLEEGGDYSVISLPTDRSAYEEGNTVTVIGWGGVGGGVSPNTLKRVEQEIPDQDTCKEYWGGVGRILAAEKGIPASVVEDMLNSGWMSGFFCTGTPELKRRFWYGDSGGPVFVEDDGTFTQLGLVSWNTPEDTKLEWLTDYDMSTDVFFYRDWIEQNMV